MGLPDLLQNSTVPSTTARRAALVAICTHHLRRRLGFAQVSPESAPGSAARRRRTGRGMKVVAYTSAASSATPWPTRTAALDHQGLLRTTPSSTSRTRPCGATSMAIATRSCAAGCATVRTGWRLDAAYELGPRYLRELTDAAHAEKPGSLVVGEIVNYPGRWLRAHDAVMNFALRHVVLGLTEGELSPAMAARMTHRLVRDAGIEPMLKSWTVIDNHDIPRAATLLPQTAKFGALRAGADLHAAGLAQHLLRRRAGHGRRCRPGQPRPDAMGPRHGRQPGVAVDAPAGGAAPHASSTAHRRPARGRVRLFAFERHTDRVLDTRIVVANPTDRPVREKIMVANADLMDDTPLVDLLGPPGAAPVAGVGAGFITVEVPPHGVMVLQPMPRAQGGYNRYRCGFLESHHVRQPLRRRPGGHLRRGEKRDWRNGAVIYQVLVDRFAPPADLQAKRALYPAPKVLRSWDETAEDSGAYLDIAQGLEPRDRVLGWRPRQHSPRPARPCAAARCGRAVPEPDPRRLHQPQVRRARLRGREPGVRHPRRRDRAGRRSAPAASMKLVLDGVFNHMGRNSPSAFAKRAGRSGQEPVARLVRTSARSTRAVRAPGGRPQNLPETEPGEPHRARACVRRALTRWCAAGCARAWTAGAWTSRWTSASTSCAELTHHAAHGEKPRFAGGGRDRHLCQGVVPVGRRRDALRPGATCCCALADGRLSAAARRSA